jgi:hypothetical protein
MLGYPQRRRPRPDPFSCFGLSLLLAVDAIAILNYAMLGPRLSRPLWPEPVAVIGKRPVPPPLQNLHHRLLNHRSSTVGMPSLRTPPSGLGISTRLTGFGS